MEFTKDDLRDLTLKLESLSAGEDYISFEKKCVPGVERFIGVHSPDLRKLAKELLKQDWRGFLALNDRECYEMNVLSAMVIAAAKCDLDERLRLIADFVPHIDNWGVCDTLCGDMKCAQANLPEFWVFIQPYLASDREFELRFGVVMLLDYFWVDAYIDRALTILKRISHEGYYVKMAVAWALSYGMIRYPDKTLPLFERGEIADKFTHNKAIQKSIESFRVTGEHKERLRTLRRK